MHTMKEKLLLISEVMSDGYLWMSVLTLAEEFERKADQGDATAREFVSHLSTVYRLCKYAKNNPTILVGE